MFFLTLHAHHCYILAKTSKNHGCNMSFEQEQSTGTLGQVSCRAWSSLLTEMIGCRWSVPFSEAYTVLPLFRVLYRQLLELTGIMVFRRRYWQLWSLETHMNTLFTRLHAQRVAEMEISSCDKVTHTHVVGCFNNSFNDVITCQSLYTHSNSISHIQNLFESFF